MRNISVIFSVLLCLFSNHTYAKQAAIATAHPLATQAGLSILQQGGNAFDAAVAVSATLAVVEPAGSGLGGGGFWLLHRASDGFQTMIDGRETAPAQAHRDMYLDADGKVIPKSSLDGALAAGIPGVPAALVHLSDQYGRLPLSQTLAPAIQQARQGFAVSEHYRKLAGFRLTALRNSADARRIFLRNGDVPAIGTIIKQPELANTLQTLAEQGHAGFYQGTVAAKLVNSVQQAGGIWTLQDLANYRIEQRQPITTTYQGYHITSAALPSSGGIVLASMLNQLANFDLEKLSTPQRRHLLVEVMRRAYRDRAQYLGDSDFIAVPVEKLTSQQHAQALISNLKLDRASPIAPISSTNAVQKGEDTTHFSIVDASGNRVAATLSINYPFGSGFVAAGTGVLLNDEMDDFSAQVGVANAYGLVGNEANAIAANKRPLSSMSPTFVENDHKMMVIGTPGGSRIISMVLLGIIDFIAGKDATSIVAAPRFHHQFLPDHIQLESLGFNDKDVNALKNMGHQVKQLNRQYGNMQVIIEQDGKLAAASDPRGEGSSVVD